MDKKSDKDLKNYQLKMSLFRLRHFALNAGCAEKTRLTDPKITFYLRSADLVLVF